MPEPRKNAPEGYPRLKVFHADRDFRILVFHDGIDAIPSLAASGLLTGSICYFTFSWHVSEKSLDHIAKRISEANDALGNAEEALRHVRFLLNSRDEFDRARTRFPEETCVFFNNAALLNERHFQLSSGAKEFDAIYNARANDFKRHRLTREVGNKAFLCYDWKWADLDLRELSPREIFRNVKGLEVADIVGRGRTGLILSAEEGACYASLEYLLCGLPVISTPSIGGRDEFYTPQNSIICDPSPEAVAQAVKTALSKLDDTVFDPARIRADALARMAWFRENLARDISASTRLFGFEPPSPDELHRKILQTNKLWRYRNMRTKSVDEFKPA
ncbi:hypothetical protein [Palleronia sp. LCG004]|uniref:hypothetical protein n=1 Tax=Palleronia sp. LCG004 TaxID=3079304 RepID=UPI002943AF96|nr:hypothetical protein [Palleronia sp. LCG004]WOI58447.1 hypothetical protein RVY76_18365 [Palleronia sp. LCG004]